MEYKLITEDHFDEVIHHLRDNFLADEPLNKAAGLCTKGAGNRDLEQLTYETLEDNLSLMAVNGCDEIAGVILCGILQPGDIECSQKKLELNDDENFKKIFQLLYAHNLKVNIFEKFHVDRVFDVRILSVDGRFRGQGIAKELVQRCEQVARDFEFKLMKADGTGIFSQKVLRTAGFEVLNELYYDKYTDDRGKPILKVAPPHLKLQTLYKLLN